MKPTAVLAMSCMLAATNAAVQAQQFQNLDFELAAPVFTGAWEEDRYQNSAHLLPHWVVEAGGSVSGSHPVAYNTYGHIGTDPPLMHVFGGDGASGDFPTSANHFRAAVGAYSAMLDPRSTWTSLTQTGFIPAGMQSLRFFGDVDDESFPQQLIFPSVEVSLNGMVLPLYELGPLAGATYRFGIDPVDREVFQFGVNIPAALAGTTAILRFHAEDNARLTLDDIRFSPVAIPEPASALIFGLATLAFVGCARLQRQRSNNQ